MEWTRNSDHYFLNINHLAAELCSLQERRKCVGGETLSRQMAPRTVMTPETDGQGGLLWARCWLPGWWELSRTATVRMLGSWGSLVLTLFFLSLGEEVKGLRPGRRIFSFHSFIHSLNHPIHADAGLARDRVGDRFFQPNSVCWVCPSVCCLGYARC